MVGAALGKEGFELLPDGLDEVRWECGHGACSFRSGSLENSPHDGASVPALHHDALPIDGSSYSQQPKGMIIKTESIRVFAKGVGMPLAIQDNVRDFCELCYLKVAQS